MGSGDLSVRRDQDDQAKKRLRELVEEGLNSGQGRVLTPQVAAQLREQALGRLRGILVDGQQQNWKLSVGFCYPKSAAAGSNLPGHRTEEERPKIRDLMNRFLSR